MHDWPKTESFRDGYEMAHTEIGVVVLDQAEEICNLKERIELLEKTIVRMAVGVSK